GDIVRFTWVDGFHTTTSTSVPAGAATWDHNLDNSNPTFDYTITVAGSYSYQCNPHAALGMVGTFSVAATGIAPVKLVNFAAIAFSNTVRLSWKTLTETSTDHFSVQISYDGINFAEAGTVKAAGNSTSELTYSFTVANISPSKRFIYFRLLTVDKDKIAQYSDVILFRQ